ncbi:MAG: TfoX/Sxy family protein [Chloroflexota bacterium]|nr:TfoX/Sxy family protein [Chloroflexota bacterium]
MSDHAGPRSPKSDEASRAAFRELVPDDERVTVRPMFGSVAAFANGQMFMGLYAEDLFVRLGEAEREQVIAGGGGPLEPMPGRPMREYVTLPGWREDAASVRGWAERALAYALSLPPKKR